MKTSRLVLFLFSFVIFSLLTVSSFGQGGANKRKLIKIMLENRNDIRALDDMALDFATHRVEKHAEVIVNGVEIDEIHRRGFKTEIISLGDPPATIDDNYKSYQEMLDILDEYALYYPDITSVRTIGYSQRLGLKIQAIKISDNPDVEEDEPAIMFNGQHHAREPVGAESCLKIIEYLLHNYNLIGRVANWVNYNEIWIVPMVNPEGWQFMVDSNFVYPWWRKNLRDNNHNGIIDGYGVNGPIDGVDLNRNYHNKWTLGGSSAQSSNTYRGPSPFSESETRAIRDLSMAQKFLTSISYHSYGEIVIYPWNNGDAPDEELIYEMVSEVAGRIPKYNRSGFYNPSVTSINSGMSMNWMYAKNGTIEFIVETCDEFMPQGNKALSVAEDNLQGALYLIDRLDGSGVTGNITDAQTGEPLVAIVVIPKHHNPDLTPRTSDHLYGRYTRLLQSGLYTIEVSKEGYKTKTITHILVDDDIMTEVDVLLEPGSSAIGDIIIGASGQEIQINNHPNPFYAETRIDYKLNKSNQVVIKITDMSGKEVCTLINEKQLPGEHSIKWSGNNYSGGKVSPGYYILTIRAGNQFGNLKILMME